MLVNLEKFYKENPAKEFVNKRGETHQISEKKYCSKLDKGLNALQVKHQRGELNLYAPVETYSEKFKQVLTKQGDFTGEMEFSPGKVAAAIAAGTYFSGAFEPKPQDSLMGFGQNTKRDFGQNPKGVWDKTPKGVSAKAPKAILAKTPKGVLAKTPQEVLAKTPKGGWAKIPKGV